MEDAGSSLKYLIITELLHNNVSDIHFAWFMAVMEQICVNYSVKVKVNLTLLISGMCEFCECVCMCLCACMGLCYQNWDLLKW